MHKIFDLKEMDIDQLRSLASELNVKGFKKMEKDDLVYAILDEEARQNAANAPEKPAKAKRGRPKKAEKPAATTAEQPKEEPAAEKNVVEEKEEKTAETPATQQKKRGRKPKSTQKPAEEKSAVDAPVAEAEVKEVAGNMITFTVTAYDEAGKIGEGTHKRAVISTQRFLDKTYAKM